MSGICIFSEKTTPRLEYVLNFLEEEFFGFPIQIVNHTEEINQSNYLKINYSNQNKLSGFQIKPQGLLFETGIKKFDYSELEEDIFSFIFFLLSRYEEYLPFHSDNHNRFPAKESWLHKTNRLTEPIVDQIALKLCEQLKQQNPEIEFKERQFEFINTIDVDQTWKVKNHSVKRNVLAFGKQIVNLDFSSLKERVSIIRRKQDDPYFQFDFIKENHQKYNLKTIFFWQVGKNGKFDKNNSIQNKSFRHLIREISEWANSGLHPSYQSNQDFSQLKNEFQNLNSVHSGISKSRQHYIKLNFPETYKNLLKVGIKEDYTMGFADESGFRAGTCSSFYWYDLTEEKQTELKVYPFCTMDVTLQRYEKLSNQKALEKIEELIKKVKQVNGTFIPIFHTQNFTEKGNWKGWKQIYESMLKAIDED